MISTVVDVEQVLPLAGVDARRHAPHAKQFDLVVAGADQVAERRAVQTAIATVHAQRDVALFVCRACTCT